jgi:hypothetical protein
MNRRLEGKAAVKALLFVALLLTTCSAAGGVADAAEPLWRQLMPREAVEADPNGDYTLTENNGPWLIMACSFNGEGAETEARSLALELRQRYNLAAFTYAMKFQIGDERIGRGIDNYGAPIRRRYKRGNEVLEYAVLVGEFHSLDDPDAQAILERVKTVEPECLQTSDPDETTRSLAHWRQFYESLKKTVGKNGPMGPMSHAFISRNPLLPREYFTPGLDPEVAKWNRELDYSALKCPGKYTIKVATFRGRSTLQGADDFSDGPEGLRMAKDNDPLVVAAKNAHTLAEALRVKGWEAYEFHDRHESYVTIGSFNEMQQLADGRLLPATRDAQIIIGVFGAATPNVGFEKPAYQELGVDANEAREVEQSQAKIMQQFTAHFSEDLADGFHPKRFMGLPFDIQPQPIVAPKESIGAAYARQ